MPLIVFALLTAPLTVFFTGPFLEQVLQALITLSFESQKLPGAVILVPQVSTIVQMSVILGLLWIALWTTKWRRLGVIPLAMGGLLFMLDRPPDVYIAPEQNLIGYYDGQEKKAWVNTLQSGRFARKAWLQLVGAPQVLKLTDKNKCDHYTAAKSDGCYRITKGNTRLHFTQKHLMKCHKKIYTLTVDVEKEGRNSPLLLSQDFKKNGAYFLWIDEKGVTTQSVKDISGNRPWR